MAPKDKKKSKETPKVRRTKPVTRSRPSFGKPNRKRKMNGGRGKRLAMPWSVKSVRRNQKKQNKNVERFAMQPTVNVERKRMQNQKKDRRGKRNKGERHLRVTETEESSYCKKEAKE